MAEWIREAPLPVNAPGSLMIGERLHIGGAGGSRTVDQPTGIIGEDLDAGGRHPDRSRAGLANPARHGLMKEEWRTAQVQSGDAAQVPEQIGPKGTPVPADRGLGVRDDEHHRQR